MEKDPEVVASHSETQPDVPPPESPTYGIQGDGLDAEFSDKTAYEPDHPHFRSELIVVKSLRIIFKDRRQEERRQEDQGPPKNRERRHPEEGDRRKVPLPGFHIDNQPQDAPPKPVKLGEPPSVKDTIFLEHGPAYDEYGESS